MWTRLTKGVFIAALIATEAVAPALAAAPSQPIPAPVRTAPAPDSIVVAQFPARGAPRGRVVAPRGGPRVGIRPGGPAFRPGGPRLVQPGGPRFVRPGRPFVAPGRPFARPGRPFVSPGFRHAYRPWRRRNYYGAVIGGVVIGTILAVGVAGAAPPPPAEGLCWFWSDEFQQRGYWDYCE